jgi:hypothetical protein
MPYKEYPKKTSTKVIVHACPGDGISRMECCNRTPFEVPQDDQLTRNPMLVTCGKGKRNAAGTK